MADVRSLLKNARAARRIQHKYASYSTTGTLLCTVCHLQLKSETLWEGHLRSAGHIMRVQKLQDRELEATDVSVEDSNNKKRKASDGEDTIRKRSKAANGSLEELFDPAVNAETKSKPPINPSPPNEIQIPSRPATPLKPVEQVLKRPDVDEDEWAAFEADIAATDARVDTTYDDGVISAPAVSAAELVAKEKEEDSKRDRERQEAEMEGDKEDAARKLEDEFEEMESLEQRVRRLREKREALRKKESVVALAPTTVSDVPIDAEDDDDDEDDDDWDGFRMKG